MEYNEQSIDQRKITSIIEKRLVHAPSEMKNKFPEVLKQMPIQWLSIMEQKYFMIVFLTPQERQRVNEFTNKRLNPFPGLITTGNEGAAFRFEKSRHMLVRSCKISNSFTFSLGRDSTILLEDHSQDIKTQDLGHISYKIPLAFIISYGEEINKTSLYDYLENLVAYSTNLWRKAHE